MISKSDLHFCVRVARLLGARSRAVRARVGCVIWDAKLRTIVSVGYNGTPPGSDNTMEIDNVTLDSVIHAEMNCLSKLSFFQKHFSNNLLMVVTHTPCLKCAQEIVKTKMKHVYYLDNYGNHAGLLLLREKKIPMTRIVEQ